MNVLPLLTFLLHLTSFFQPVRNVITITRNGTSIKTEGLEEEEEMSKWREIVDRCDPRMQSMFIGNVSLLTSINHYEPLNVSSECPRRYQTCSGENSIINLCSVALDGIPSCDCSDDCYKFSSCCIDSPIIQESMNSTINDVIESNSCLDLLKYSDTEWPFIVRTKCSPKWSSDKSWVRFNEIRDGCEKRNSSDFFRQVLVSSKDSHVTYQNIFCLVCNFDLKDPRDIIFWPSTILCDAPHPNLTETATSPSAQVTDFIMNDSSNCTIWNHKPKNGEIPFKPCYEPNMVEATCRKNWLRSSPDYQFAVEIQRLCHLIHSPVIMIRNAIIPGSEEVVFFRNKFCAACQDILLKDLFCLDHFLPPRSARQDERRVTAHAVMSIRMQMNEECESRDMMWDPFGNVCRRAFCENGFNFCSPSISSGSLSRKTTFSSLKCNVYSIQVICPLFSILLLFIGKATNYSFKLDCRETFLLN